MNTSVEDASRANVPIISDNFPYTGDKAEDARRYALDSSFTHGKRGSAGEDHDVPSDPAIVFPAAKLSYYRRQSSCDNSLQNERYEDE